MGIAKLLKLWYYVDMSKKKKQSETQLTKQGFIKDISPKLDMIQKLLKSATKTTIVVGLVASIYASMFSLPSDQAKHPPLEDLIVGENVLDLIDGKTTTQQKSIALELLQNKLIEDANFIGGNIDSISSIDAIYTIPYIFEGYEETLGQLDILITSGNKKYCLTYDNSYVDFEVKNDNDVNVITSFVAGLQLCGVKNFQEMSPIQQQISENIPGGYFAGNYYIYTQKGGLVNYNIPVYYKDGNEIKCTVYSASKTSLDNYDKDPYLSLNSQITDGGEDEFKVSGLTPNSDFVKVINTANQMQLDLFFPSIEQ